MQTERYSICNLLVKTKLWVYVNMLLCLLKQLNVFDLKSSSELKNH